MRWCNYLLKPNLWSLKRNSNWESHGCNKIQNQFYLVWGLLDSCLFIGTNWPLIITYITLFFFSLLCTFYRVAKKKEANMMTEENLSIVFGPTLMRAPDSDTSDVLTDMKLQRLVIESLITNQDILFDSWLQQEAQKLG